MRRRLIRIAAREATREPRRSPPAEMRPPESSSKSAAYKTAAFYSPPLFPFHPSSAPLAPPVWSRPFDLSLPPLSADPAAQTLPEGLPVGEMRLPLSSNSFR